MQRIVTNLWFDGKVEEALGFYTAIFDDSRVKSIINYGEAGPGPAGEIMVATFELAGQAFTIINGGPHFTHSPAMSLEVKCETQAEIDTYWEKLTADGGSPGECGWLTDRYGISWQVTPSALDDMLMDDDEAKTERVMRALLAMKKLDISALEEAYNGE